VQTGTVNHSVIYPREIALRAAESGASYLVLVHNHPSGNCEPSKADINMTGVLAKTLKSMDITLIDHIIVTPDDVITMKEKGINW
jgi:DNA repair protein RadC